MTENREISPREKAKKLLLLVVFSPAVLVGLTLLNEFSKKRLEKVLILHSDLTIMWIVVLIVSLGTLVQVFLLLRKDYRHRK
jgi:hypothetical protein